MYKHTTDIHNTKAAEILVPHLLESISVKSVLDVGMGIGTWLKVFQDNGIDDILGIDGAYVNKELFFIDEKYFKSHDLRTGFNLGRKFDLVVSLEVIEHIPKEFEDIFIENLINHGDTILFSGAIPGQGGQNHFNEQWQSYWISKFQEKGYGCYDIIRPMFWDNKNIEWWYRQNMLLFSKADLKFSKVKSLKDIVSRELFEKKMQQITELNTIIEEKENLIKRLNQGQIGLKQPINSLFRAIKNKFS